MPVYGYVCLDCEEGFDKFYSYEEYNPKKKPTCPHCKTKNVNRRMGSTPAPAIYRDTDFTQCKSFEKGV